MKEISKYVGLDVHKETIAVSVAESKVGEAPYRTPEFNFSFDLDICFGSRQDARMIRLFLQLR